VTAPARALALLLASGVAAACARAPHPAWTLRRRTEGIPVALAADRPVERYELTIALDDDAVAVVDGSSARGELFVRAQGEGEGGQAAAFNASVVSSDGAWGGSTRVVANPGETGLLTLYVPFETTRCGAPCILAVALELQLESGSGVAGNFEVEVLLYGPQAKMPEGATPELDLWIDRSPS
jgi:hypothetical protein